MFSGRIHAAMLDNRMNTKKPFMNQYFMNTGHGAGEGVKPLNFRPPITGNSYYRPHVLDKPGMNTSAIVGNPNMRHYLAEQLGRKTMVGNEGISEQGRSPM